MTYIAEESPDIDIFLALVKFKKHKLSKDYQKNLAKLQRILGVGLLAVSSSHEKVIDRDLIFKPTSSEKIETVQMCIITALAIEDLTNASKFKLYQGNYWCKVNSFIDTATDRSLNVEDKAIAYMQENSLATYCKVNKDWLFTIDKNFLNDFITNSEILTQIAIARRNESWQ